MASKKSSTRTEPTAPKRPRARKKPDTATPPVATPAQPMAAQPMVFQADPAEPTAFRPAALPSSSRRWLALIAGALAAALLIGLLLEINHPLNLAAAHERLVRMEAGLDGTSGERAELASAQRVARACREGLRSMVRMWNRYVGELKAAEASPARFRAARRRFDEAQERASLAVRRCEDA